MQGFSTLNETNVCIKCRRGSLPIRILCSIPVNNTIHGILYIKKLQSYINEYKKISYLFYQLQLSFLQIRKVHMQVYTLTWICKQKFCFIIIVHNNKKSDGKLFKKLMKNYVYIYNNIIYQYCCVVC